MADNIVPLNNNEENIFEFELAIKGLDAKNIDAKFVIQSSEMDLSFPCTEGPDGKWQVKLPPLPMLEHTMYPYHFAIVAENHHFTPLSGSINVVGSRDVFVTTPKKKLTSPVKTIEEHKEPPKPQIIPKSQPVRGREKSIEQIANEMVQNRKPTAKPINTQAPTLVKVDYNELKEHPKPTIEPVLPSVLNETNKGEKDDAARKVLEEMGIKVKSTRTKKRFSVLKDKPKKESKEQVKPTVTEAILPSIPIEPKQPPTETIATSNIVSEVILPAIPVDIKPAVIESALPSVQLIPEIVESIPPVVNEKKQETKLIRTESILPSIKLDLKMPETNKGEKDDAARKVLEEMGINVKSKSRFSILKSVPAVEPSKVESNPIIETTPTIQSMPISTESILPSIHIDTKSNEPKRGEKDQAARKVLEDMGIKVKSKKRFSVFGKN